MEEFNFKNEFKRVGIEFLDEMYSMLCIVAVALYILLHQTEEQLKAVSLIIKSSDWLILIPIIAGVVIIGYVVRQIITFTWKVIVFLVKLIFKKRNGNT